MVRAYAEEKIICWATSSWECLLPSLWKVRVFVFSFFLFIYKEFFFIFSSSFLLYLLLLFFHFFYFFFFSSSSLLLLFMKIFTFLSLLFTLTSFLPLLNSHLFFFVDISHVFFPPIHSTPHLFFSFLPFLIFFFCSSLFFAFYRCQYPHPKYDHIRSRAQSCPSQLDQHREHSRERR